jgi:HEAT repeat protein
MKKRYYEHYEADTTSSREVARLYRETIYDDDSDVTLTLIHYRGGEEEFFLGKEYCSSDDAGDRVTGVDILAQLGWDDFEFQDESVAILTNLLGDTDSFALYRAASALGRRGAQSAIPKLIELSEHPDSLVRYGVVFGLTGEEDDRAIATLIKLTCDDDRDVRDWAVFGLGTQIDSDTAAIRDALRRVLQDSDSEIRGEALVGLAKRKDPEIVCDLMNEWRDDDVSLLSLEAAEEARDSRLYQRLKSFSEIVSLVENPYLAEQLASATEACKPKDEQDSSSNV